MSSQFRDIATIVMQKTYNHETQRPYTISMIERLMREIHFAVDPNSSSKKQVIWHIKFSSELFNLFKTPLDLSEFVELVVQQKFIVKGSFFFVMYKNFVICFVVDI